MNVLSLFDGISAGQLALNRVGIPITIYYASEIDKYAIKVTQHHFPDTIQIGDVRNVKACDLPVIDLILAGSPCQGFSFAGKQLAFEDPRSKLFFEFVRILQEVKPRYWLLENVKMAKMHEQVITKLTGVRPIRLNSALVSAQNRQRLYWTNIPVNTVPTDKGILLRDILEDGAETDLSKSPTIDAEYGKAGYSNKHAQSQRRYMVFQQNDSGKSHPIDANYFKGVGCNQKRTGVIQLNPSKECAGTQPSIQNRIYSEEAKSPALLSQMSGQLYKIAVGVAQRGRYDNNGDINQQFEMGGQKAYSLTSIAKDSMVLDGYTIRKLTVNECCRLQTFPDDWFKGIVSNSQAYKMLGNSWTVDIIVHLLKHIPL